MLSYITLPTYITLLRLVLVPFIVMSFSAQNIALALFLFIIAALTDILDGALARAWNAESQWGAFLDPLADKALLIACYSCLGYNYFPFSLIPSWFLWLVITQEIGMIMGSFYLSFIKKGETVRPTLLGKLSSFGQILFIGWLFVCGWLKCIPVGLFFFLLLLIVCVRLCTLLQYGMRVLDKEIA